MSATPAQRVGAEIRRLRRDVGLTAVDLAASCGISQPFLSQIERGIASPSLTTLYALAEALGVPAGRLLATSESEDDLSQVIRASEGIDQFATVLVPGGASDLIEAYEHRFTPGGGEREWFSHPGEDFLYVLEGSIELQRRGMPPVRLGACDHLLHQGRVPHRCVLLGDDPARVLLVSVAHDLAR